MMRYLKHCLGALKQENYLSEVINILTGIAKEKLNVSKAMLKDTNDYNLISKYTGLSIKQIKELL